MKILMYLCIGIAIVSSAPAHSIPLPSPDEPIYIPLPCTCVKPICLRMAAAPNSCPIPTPVCGSACK
jgi:hypothetical protein